MQGSAWALLFTAALATRAVAVVSPVSRDVDGVVGAASLREAGSAVLPRRALRLTSGPPTAAAAHIGGVSAMEISGSSELAPHHVEQPTGRVALLQKAAQDWDVHTGCAAEATPGSQQETPSVFVVMPGLGKPEHIPLVMESVSWLRKQANVHVSCLIYVYNPSLKFPDGEQSFSPCRMQHSTGQWTHFIQEAPETQWSQSSYVLVWLDDVKIEGAADLHSMVQVMRRNRLGVASPSYSPAVSKNRWITMQQDLRSPVGRYTNLVEFQFTLMTPGSFRCFRGMIEPDINPRGWGLDRAFVTMCPGHCLGVLDTVTMLDTSKCSYGCEAARAEMQAYTVRHGAPPEPRTLALLQL